MSEKTTTCDVCKEPAETTVMNGMNLCIDCEIIAYEEEDR